MLSGTSEDPLMSKSGSEGISCLCLLGEGRIYRV